MSKFSFTRVALMVLLVRPANGLHISDFECSTPDQLNSLHGIYLGQRTGVTTRLKCAHICSTTCSCDVIQYCPGDETCALYGTCPGCVTAMNVSTTCSNNNVPITARMLQTEPALACGAHRYLVTDGQCSVADGQMSVSSSWCQGKTTHSACIATPDGHGARWARLNSFTVPLDTWVPTGSTLGEYIQVDFVAVKTATGVEVHGRLGCCDMYVTAFKMFYSNDCETFTPIRDQLANEKVFAGCSFREDKAVRCFDEPITARCFRLYPTSWVGLIALRFDILGV